MPRREKLRGIILDSKPSEWDQFNDPSTWTLWDEELTISDIGHHGSGEPLTVRKPDFLRQSETDFHEKSTIRIQYRGTPFDQLPVLHLDSDRFRLVKPNFNQSTDKYYLSEYEFHLSQIIASQDIMELRGDVIQLDILEE